VAARERAQRWLQNIWYGAVAAPLTLRALATVYGTVMRARTAAYRTRVLRSHGSGRPLIVVGNLTVGGSGKTPLVIWVCEQLRELGLHPGVVLRGYGGSAGRAGPARRVDGSCEASVVGDEALLLWQRLSLPVVVGHDRVAAAREVARAGADVIVADDGLQHLRLARDFELVVIDASRGLGNGRLLPAGPLRESVSRLARAQALVLNGTAEVALPAAADRVPRFQMQLSGGELLALDGARSAPLTSLAGHRVHAVAGIGHPERFFGLLDAAELVVIRHPFADHHVFRREELVFGDGLPLLMTEKDAVKCRSLGLQAAWYLPVSAGFPQVQAVRLREMLRAAVMR
jgi:tetraacyldisaccharide 4'-kinase